MRSVRIRVLIVAVVARCIVPSAVACADHIRIDHSPFRFIVTAPKAQDAELTLTAIQRLHQVSINGQCVAESMPIGSTLTLRPDGKALFTYSDLFLRHFRGREQVLKSRMFRNPAEDFLHFPKDAQPPKFLQDIWKVDAKLLRMNHGQDILWWTGELTYRFDFSYPLVSLKLESPEGRRTTVGDWEWRKVGRAVKIFASTDGQNWSLLWQSHDKGGMTPVEVSLPETMKGARTVFIKFWGQAGNVLFDLFVTAWLDAHDAVQLLKLKEGKNSFVFEDGRDSSHHVLVGWRGKGLRITAPERSKTMYPSRKPVVRVSDDELAVLFPQKVGVWLAKKDAVVSGIKRIMCGRREIVAALWPEGSQAPVASVITGGRIEPVKDWVAYLKERKGRTFAKRGGLEITKASLEGSFEGWRREGEWVVVTAKHESGGKVEWLFAPAKEAIGGGAYTGIKWKLRLTGLGRVYEVVVTEPVVFDSGDWHFTQVWGPFQEHQLSLSNQFQLPERGYFARQQPFFFLAGGKGATVSFFGTVVHAMVSEARDLDRIAVRAAIPVKAGQVAETAEKVWLFREGDFSSKWDALNEWTWVFDSLADRYRTEKGIQVVEPTPTRGWQVVRFEDFAREIPKVAQWGVRVVYLSGALESDADKRKADYLLNSRSFGSVCGPWKLEVSSTRGGEEGLKHLCEVAHKHGVKVVLWSTPAHLSNSSPLLREHPEWLAWRWDGTPETMGYGDITGVRLRSGYFDYAIRQYEKIRGATGFDGLWQDSFLTFGILTDFSEPSPYPQLDETVEMQRRLQAMGCTEIHIEGCCGPFGLSTGGYGMGNPKKFALIKGKEYGLYYYLADTAVEPESYFRALASKGIVALKPMTKRVKHSPPFEKLPPEVRERVVKANHAYLQALPFMKRRRLLGEGENWQGVEWLDNRGRARVLFAFEPIKYRTQKKVTVTDLTNGTQSKVTNGVLHAEPWHVYLLR